VKFVMSHDLARRRAIDAVTQAPAGYVVTVKEPSRSLDQNAALWPLLTEFSEQLLWPVNGRMVKMEPEEWKDVLSAAFRGEQARLAIGLNGGVVMLGLRTSKMGKRQFSEFLDFLHATAVDRGISLDRVAA
jgi:hypothetical protein